MPETVSSNEQVLFRVTRPNTSIFHPDRSVSLVPVQTGGEIKLPKAMAEYHARNGVGEIVGESEAEKPVEEPADGPQAEETPAPVKRGPGRPAKASQ